MQLANWLDSVAAKRWPILPQTHARLQLLLARGGARLRYEELANLTLSDPFLLLDLLRLLASSAALQRSDSLPAVEQMLMVIGSDRILARYRQLPAWPAATDARSAAVQEEVASLMGRARIAALIIKSWLSFSGEHKIEDSFIAAEIYNLPACLYLLQRQHLTNRPVLQDMSEQFALDYPRLLSAFIQRMPLPVGLNGLLGEGAPSRRRQLLKLAVATAEGVDQGWWRASWQVGIDAAARLMGVGYAEAYAATVHAVLHVARHSEAPAYAFAARRFLALEGEIPLMLEPALVPALDAGARADLAVREALRHLANDLGFERVLFYRLDQAAAVLRLQFQIGLKTGDPLLHLVPALTPGSLLTLLLKRPQGFLVPQHQRAQLQAKYGDAWLAMLGSHDVALLSLYAGSAPLGVFLVDNAISGHAIDEASYKRFKITATRVANQIF
ncbi:histidine kinase [Craterilacuibacter sp.]|uniref:histidine kinase n=1 Tax=Craterilacuibacter sp. TaxID=2870909 RepID=UPI003F304302